MIRYMTHAAPWLTATAKLFAIAPTALFKIICHCPRRTIHLTPMRVCVCVTIHLNDPLHDSRCAPWLTTKLVEKILLKWFLT